MYRNVIVLALFITLAFGATFTCFIDSTTGDDTANDGTQASPFKTATKCVSANSATHSDIQVTVLGNYNAEVGLFPTADTSLTSFSLVGGCATNPCSIVLAEAISFAGTFPTLNAFNVTGISFDVSTLTNPSIVVDTKLVQFTQTEVKYGSLERTIQLTGTDHVGFDTVALQSPAVTAFSVSSDQVVFKSVQLTNFVSATANAIAVTNDGTLSIENMYSNGTTGTDGILKITTADPVAKSPVLSINGFFVDSVASKEPVLSIVGGTSATFPTALTMSNVKIASFNGRAISVSKAVVTMVASELSSSTKDATDTTASAVLLTDVQNLNLTQVYMTTFAASVVPLEVTLSTDSALLLSTVILQDVSERIKITSTRTNPNTYSLTNCQFYAASNPPFSIQDAVAGSTVVISTLTTSGPFALTDASSLKYQFSGALTYVVNPISTNFVNATLFTTTGESSGSLAPATLQNAATAPSQSCLSRAFVSAGGVKLTTACPVVLNNRTEYNSAETHPTDANIEFGPDSDLVIGQNDVFQINGFANLGGKITLVATDAATPGSFPILACTNIAGRFKRVYVQDAQTGFTCRATPVYGPEGVTVSYTRCGAPPPTGSTVEASEYTPLDAGGVVSTAAVVGGILAGIVAIILIFAAALLLTSFLCRPK